jgi:hypothetical protein
MKENILNRTSCSYSFKSSPYIKLFAIFCLLLIFGCKAKKPIIVKKVVADTTAKAVDYKLIKINAIKAAQTVFNTFSGKARASLNINGDSNDVTLNIRIKSDQKIWVSITAIAGIEVARALITPDSVLLINRLQNLYVKQPFSYVNKVAGDQVNYKTLESLLIGNAVPDFLNENSDIQIVNGATQLSGNLSAMMYKVMFGPDLKVTQTNLSDQEAGQALQATNSVFIQSGNRVMPSQVDISTMVKSKKILVNLRYIKEEFDQPLDFPFSIPSRYKPAEIN